MRKRRSSNSKPPPSPPPKVISSGQSSKGPQSEGISLASVIKGLEAIEQRRQSEEKLVQDIKKTLGYPQRDFLRYIGEMSMSHSQLHK